MFFSKSAFLFRFLIFFRLRLPARRIAYPPPPSRRISLRAVLRGLRLSRCLRKSCLFFGGADRRKTRIPRGGCGAPGLIARIFSVRLCRYASVWGDQTPPPPQRAARAAGEMRRSIYDKIKPRRPKPTIQRPRRGACSPPRRREHRRARRAYCPAAAGAIARQACRICPGK